MKASIAMTQIRRAANSRNNHNIRRSLQLESLENRALLAGLVATSDAVHFDPVGDAPPVELWDVPITGQTPGDSLLGPGGLVDRNGQAANLADAVQPSGAAEDPAHVDRAMDELVDDVIVEIPVGRTGEEFVFFTPRGSENSGLDDATGTPENGDDRSGPLGTDPGPCESQDHTTPVRIATGQEVLAGGNPTIDWDRLERENGKVVFYRLGHLSNDELHREAEYYANHLRNGVQMTVKEFREIEYRQTELANEIYARGDEYLGDLAAGRATNISTTPRDEDAIEWIAGWLPDSVVRNQCQVDRFTLDVGGYVSLGFIGVSGGVLFAYDFENGTWDTYGYAGTGAGTPGIGGHVYGGQGRNINDADDLTGRSTSAGLEVGPPAANGVGLGGAVSGNPEDPLNSPYIVEGGLSLGVSPIPWAGGSVHEQYFWLLGEGEAD